MLLRATDDAVEVIMFLFPYYRQEKERDGFGMQALMFPMFPMYQCNKQSFLESKFLEFLLLLTIKSKDNLRIPLPQDGTFNLGIQCWF